MEYSEAQHNMGADTKGVTTRAVLQIRSEKGYKKLTLTMPPIIQKYHMEYIIRGWFDKETRYL